MEPVLTEVSSPEVVASEEVQKPFLLDRLGGPDALNAAVDIFYERIIADAQLSKFFDGISMTRLKVHQSRFLKFAFTEFPADMDVPTYMIEKHSKLFQEQGLNGTHFDLVAGHLVASLKQLKVPEDLIGEAVDIVGPLRPVFVNEAERIANDKKD